MAALPNSPALRVVGRDEDTSRQNVSDAARASSYAPPQAPYNISDLQRNSASATPPVGLAGYVTDQFIMMRRHRDTVGRGWSDRLLSAMRAYNGIYEPNIVEELKRFGGSNVYSRIIAMKCRGTSSLLRDVYLGADQPWAIEPAEDPQVPPDVMTAVAQQIKAEVTTAVAAHENAKQANLAHAHGVAAAHAYGAQQGIDPSHIDQAIPSQTSGPSQGGAAGTAPPNLPIPPGAAPGAGLPPPPEPKPLPEPSRIRQRYNDLVEAVRDQAKRKAAEQAKIAEDKIQEDLAMGGFYTALAEFLVDLPLFPYAVMKGPVVRIKTQVKWTRDVAPWSNDPTAYQSKNPPEMPGGQQGMPPAGLTPGGSPAISGPPPLSGQGDSPETGGATPAPPFLPGNALGSNASGMPGQAGAGLAGAGLGAHPLSPSGGMPTPGTPAQPQMARPMVMDIPVLCWERVSPFDIYWTPGVSDIADANVIQRSRLTRAEINDLLDLPGFITNEVRAVLDEYGRGGLVDNWDMTDAERAILENREDPRFNQSGLINCLEFQGMAQGRHLLDLGVDPSLVPDPLRDYYCNCWLIGRHIIKVQLNMSPRKRHQYYVTSFEKVPGNPVGNGLPDLLADISSVANATLRSLVNNLCLTGDTVLYRAPLKPKSARGGASAWAGRSRSDMQITLRKVFEQGGKTRVGHGGYKNIQLRAMDEATGEICCNIVDEVHDNGVQDVFRIKTHAGYKIKATAGHRFLKQGVGWTTVANLKIGDRLGVNGTVVKIPWNEHQAQQALTNRKASETTARGRKLVRDQLKDHCEECGVLADSAELHIHHLDKDPWNGAPANLRTLCERCHNDWHIRYDHYGDAYKHCFVDFDRIVEIKYVGREQTYCLTMKAPNHNFVANGFISHNSIASGPQVTVNDDRLGDGENGEDMYPWKRWHVKADPFGNNTEKAIEFFSPASNSQELMQVYMAFSQMADEHSAIPKFMTGSPPVGGLGRTASGLSMLMQNSSKILQTVAANIDRDVISPMLEGLFDIIMQTDETGLLSGEEKIRVMGVQVAMQRETQRARQLEFLQMTANPIDMQIIGPKGRAQVLRKVASEIGLPGEDIVPTDDEMDQKQKAQEAQAMQMMQTQAGGGGAPGSPPGGAPSPGGGPGGSPGGGSGGPPSPGGPGSPPGPAGGLPSQAKGGRVSRDVGPRTNLMNPDMGGGAAIQGGEG